MASVEPGPLANRVWGSVGGVAFRRSGGGVVAARRMAHARARMPFRPLSLLEWSDRIRDQRQVLRDAWRSWRLASDDTRAQYDDAAGGAGRGIGLVVARVRASDVLGFGIFEANPGLPGERSFRSTFFAGASLAGTDYFEVDELPLEWVVATNTNIASADTTRRKMGRLASRSHVRVGGGILQSPSRGVRMSPGVGQLRQVDAQPLAQQSVYDLWVYDDEPTTPSVWYDNGPKAAIIGTKSDGSGRLVYVSGAEIDLGVVVTPRRWHNVTLWLRNDFMTARVAYDGATLATALPSNPAQDPGQFNVGGALSGPGFNLRGIVGRVSTYLGPGVPLINAHNFFAGAGRPTTLVPEMHNTYFLLSAADGFDPGINPGNGRLEKTDLVADLGAFGLIERKRTDPQGGAGRWFAWTTYVERHRIFVSRNEGYHSFE